MLLFFAIDSTGGASFVKAFAAGFAMRDRLFGGSPETSVYFFADAAFGGMEDASLRFGGIFDNPARLLGCVQRAMDVLIRVID